MRTRSWCALAASVSLLAPSTVLAQGYPVFDSSTFSQLVMTVKALTDQVRQLKANYDAITGTRGMGDIFWNPELRQYLPADWMHVYDAAMAGDYAGISGRLQAIAAAERLGDDVPRAQAEIAARSRATSLTDKAVGVQAFEGAKARLAQIEALMAEVNRTQDPKGIAELQARIAIEQAAVGNEATKLQLVAMLQAAEARLIEEQKGDLARKILSASNTGMPPCCSPRFSP